MVRGHGQEFCKMVYSFYKENRHLDSSLVLAIPSFLDSQYFNNTKMHFFLNFCLGGAV